MSVEAQVYLALIAVLCAAVVWLASIVETDGRRKGRHER